MGEKFNRLGSEKSPYLLQHKDNPVHWYPWGKEAFAAAKAEQKPIFLSIGYSTCYWCHAMAHESFEDREVADLLNSHYISIKVDREEHPDVDQLYMDAVVALQGHGGWPLNAFLTPELKPFFGYAFLQKHQLINLLLHIQETWLLSRDRVLSAAESITEALKRITRQNTTEPSGAKLVQQAYAQLKENFDPVYGGFSQAPKFPASMTVSLLLYLYQRTHDEDALHMAVLTLEKMACGGIYDHVGGGFHRYAVDARWQVPHFEKTLYDNALLASLYLEAFQVVQNGAFCAVAGEVLEYILREMQDPAGGFYCAQDAGEIGREGEFYTWHETELEAVLSPDEFAMLGNVYQLTEMAQSVSGQKVLSLLDDSSWSIKEQPQLKRMQQKLFSVRSTRNPLHKDDKIITAWNALMISAMCKAFRVLGSERYLEAAKNCALFIKEKLAHEGHLLRRYRDDEAKIAGCLEDYVYLIQALLDLHESDGNAEWILWAKTLQDTLDQSFWSEEAGGYCFSSAEDPYVIARKVDWFDGAIPSANNIATSNLRRLHQLTAAAQYKDKAEQLLASMLTVAVRYPSAFCSGMIVLDSYLREAKEEASG
jgi:uncharacterized protein